jgi:hypothetical protein
MIKLVIYIKKKKCISKTSKILKEEHEGSDILGYFRILKEYKNHEDTELKTGIKRYFLASIMHFNWSTF